MELDFDKYCVVEGSPTTVLQAPRPQSKVGNRKSNGNLKCGNDIRTINENFAEISFNRYRSASCRDVPRTSAKREGNEVLRRGSVYQSSREVRLKKKIVPVEGRKKIELSRGSAPILPFGIIDSLCSSDEDSLPVDRKRSSVMSLNSDQSTASVSNPCIELSSRNYLNHSFRPCPGKSFPPNVSSLCLDYGENQSVVDANSQPVQDPKTTCEPVTGPVNDGNILRYRDQDVIYHKSLSEKLALSHFPSRSESDSSRASSPKVRFSPVRKLFDPFVKAKSQRSPLSSANEAGQETLTGIKPNKILLESLPQDLAEIPNDLECNSWCQEKENCSSVLQCSPAHLHGVLKLENKHGVPFFKFSVKSPEDVYVAKTWKPDNALTSVYTFHSLHHRRKNNASGWGLRNDNKESSVVGQMQVSCYLCTELKGAGSFDNSMVTEFVLYDIAHPTKSISSQDNSNSSLDVAKAARVSDEILYCGNPELDEVSTRKKTKLQLKHSRDSGHFNSSTPLPLLAAELHPELEIAAIIMQIPFAKRESLKFKSRDRENDKLISQLLVAGGLKQRKAGISDSASPGKMHVVIPSGNHSLPSCESRGPSPLLDRWRLGGGCDCGGWDMACPLNIFDNPNIQITEDHPPVDNQHPLELFVQVIALNHAFHDHSLSDGNFTLVSHVEDIINKFSPSVTAQSFRRGCSTCYQSSLAPIYENLHM
ncbi:uncharacterized protein LOC111392699 [Olea europaea var. sylvestris]|uniref:uncharacterized protein LOC111392699 n=1 Tax=Olea europaea var. sylvestris TaxID=158386 RepID=UPI000C1D5FF2|nr:uncharacterized protein LOC111392699 [Olea europaea var. sylvestris]XP_022873864.1 uncharacterized protein LOC111392699 [Olea europaea var. sylvestris]